MAKRKNKDIAKAEKQKQALPKERPVENMKLLQELADDPNVMGYNESVEERNRKRGTGEPLSPSNLFYGDNENIENEKRLKLIDKMRGKGNVVATMQDKALAKGGIPKQMEMFEDGGLKDEGGEVDEESGNEVPSGSTKEEVRDDIPARLSEGEFVFPADVVRYLGLDFLMRLRQKAKAGLQKMEDMGQMGNSDEATLPDDIPFTIDDLDMEDDTLEMQAGGIVTNPMGNPTAMPNQVTTMNNPNVYNPNINQMYTPGGITPYAPATFKSLLPDSSTGQVKTTNKRYVNKATGQVRMIPHIEGTNKPLYPIPEGFVLEESPTEEKKPKEQKVASAKVKPTESGDDSGGTSVSSASLSFGGKKDPNRPGLQTGGITANLSYNVSALGGILGLSTGLGKISDINKGKDVDTIGNKFGKTTNPVEMSYGKGKSISLTSQEYATVKNNVVGVEAEKLKERLEVLDKIASRDFSFDSKTNQYTDSLGNTLSEDEVEQAGKDINNHIDTEISKGRDMESIIDSLTNTEVSMAQDVSIEAEDDSATDDSQRSGGFDFGDTQPGRGATTSTGIGTDIDDDDDSYQDNDSGGGYSDSDSDTGGDTDDCVIATHGVSTGGFTRMEKAKAELWCQRTYHGKWYGEAFRRGYKAWGMKHVNGGTAPQVYQEFKDFVSCGRGIKKGFKLKMYYYCRTLHLFITGLFIKR